ncbi:MAG: TonB-dependent receptor [Sphingomonas bacterium]|uniref:TonB-dependent receptor n=1 Tax=Sphingomonas bacterium TaxID=1895847 RepID=UPI00262AF638|nr:TonB-dependent receptor [Sphingomonas bacterium]MDB5706927.1 TonB-dependent receptor [Sphingomonas bacterium]
MRAALRTLLITTALVTTAGAATSAFAQAAPVADDSGGLGDIIVTATKTGATKLQDTPLAVTAFNSATIGQTGIKDIRDLASLTPNLLVTQNSSFSQVYIRGIGSNNVFGGSDPSSTMHVDGVYFARPASYLGNFLDVERIEVLRGPQGTLYGRNSVGGTINVISRKPDNSFAAKAQVTVGDYDLVRGEAYVSGPIIEDKLAASLSVLRSKHSGYLKNVAPGVGDVDSEDVEGARAQLRYTPIGPLEIILRGDYNHSDDSISGYVKLLQTTADPYANSVLGDFHKIALNIRPNANRRQWGTAGEVNYDLSSALQLKSLTSYRESRLIQVGDTDGTAINTRRTDQFEDQHQFSQEFNLTGHADGLTYIAGLYYFKETINVATAVTTFPTTKAAYYPIINTNAWAGFGQATYAITDQISVTGGLRYTREHKTFDQDAVTTSLVTGLPAAGYPIIYHSSGVYTAWTPKFDVEFRPTHGILLYASATKGFKSGGFNLTSANPAQGFEPESLWSYEGGAKIDLIDDRLRLNGTVFHYNYKNLQVQSFLTPGVIDITNASDATVNGVEIEAVAKPASGVRLGANLAYLDAKYKNYTKALGPGNVPFDASGNRLNLSPKWAYTLYAEVERPIGTGKGLIRGEFSHRTRQYFTAANAGLDTQAAYGLINATIGYTFAGDHIQLLVFSRNLGDTQYITSTATFGAGVAGRVGEPRTIGVRAIFKY